MPIKQFASVTRETAAEFYVAYTVEKQGKAQRVNEFVRSRDADGACEAVKKRRGKTVKIVYVMDADKARESAAIGPIKEGGFHEWLGKSKDDPITEADIKKGLASDDPHVRKMANFAKNARKWHHPKGYTMPIKNLEVSSKRETSSIQDVIRETKRVSESFGFKFMFRKVPGTWKGVGSANEMKLTPPEDATQRTIDTCAEMLAQIYTRANGVKPTRHRAVGTPNGKLLNWTMDVDGVRYDMDLMYSPSGIEVAFGAVFERASVRETSSIQDVLRSTKKIAESLGFTYRFAKQGSGIGSTNVIKLSLPEGDATNMRTCVAMLESLYTKANGVKPVAGMVPNGASRRLEWRMTTDGGSYKMTLTTSRAQDYIEVSFGFVG